MPKDEPKYFSTVPLLTQRHRHGHRHTRTNTDTRTNTTTPVHVGLVQNHLNFQNDLNYTLTIQPLSLFGIQVDR